MRLLSLGVTKLRERYLKNEDLFSFELTIFMITLLIIIKICHTFASNPDFLLESENVNYQLILVVCYLFLALIQILVMVFLSEGQRFYSLFGVLLSIIFVEFQQHTRNKIAPYLFFLYFSNLSKLLRTHYESLLLNSIFCLMLYIRFIDLGVEYADLSFLTAILTIQSFTVILKVKKSDQIQEDGFMHAVEKLINKVLSREFHFMIKMRDFQNLTTVFSSSKEFNFSSEQQIIGNDTFRESEFGLIIDGAKSMPTGNITTGRDLISRAKLTQKTRESQATVNSVFASFKNIIKPIWNSYSILDNLKQDKIEEKLIQMHSFENLRDRNIHQSNPKIKEFKGGAADFLENIELINYTNQQGTEIAFSEKKYENLLEFIKNIRMQGQKLTFGQQSTLMSKFTGVPKELDSPESPFRMKGGYIELTGKMPARKLINSPQALPENYLGASGVGAGGGAGSGGGGGNGNGSGGGAGAGAGACNEVQSPDKNTKMTGKNSLKTQEERGKRDEDVDFGLKRSDDAIHWKIKLSMLVIGKIPMILFEFEECSAQEENKVLRKVDKFKDMMLASVTHDLRTPLNIIAVMLESCQKVALPAEIFQMIEYAATNTKFLWNLISDILDFSLIRENRLRLIVSRFSLQGILDDVVKMMKFQTEQKQNKIVIKYLKNKSDINLYSDPQRLKQILINLISNANKFTKAGLITCTIRDKFKENKLSFEIVDTGTGIAPENLKNLFKPFETFDSKDGNNNKNGIGLGLYICKKIVSQLGPRPDIIVKSQVGIGSSFEFIIYRNMKFDKYSSVNSMMSMEKHSSDMNMSSHKVKSSENNTRFQRKGSISISAEDEISRMNCSIQSKLFLDQEETLFEKIKALNSQERITNRNSNRSLFNINPFSQRSPNYDEDDFMRLMQDKSENMNSVKRISDSNHQVKDTGEKAEKRKSVTLLSAPGHQEEKSGCEYQTRIINDLFLKDSEIGSFYDSHQERVLNILIADDNMFNIFILEHHLKSLQSHYHLNIHKATNGKEAFEIFCSMNADYQAHNHLGLIFMDCEMPILDGYQTSILIGSKIREENYLPVRIVACTANSGFEEEEKCYECGMDFFFVKPISEAEIENVIRKVLSEFA